jgi:hypothetical protein
MIRNWGQDLDPVVAFCYAVSLAYIIPRSPDPRVRPDGEGAPHLEGKKGGGGGYPLPPLSAKRLLFCKVNIFISCGTTT